MVQITADNVSNFVGHPVCYDGKLGSKEGRRYGTLLGVGKKGRAPVLFNGDKQKDCDLRDLTTWKAKAEMNTAEERKRKLRGGATASGFPPVPPPAPRPDLGKVEIQSDGMLIEGFDSRQMKPKERADIKAGTLLTKSIANDWMNSGNQPILRYITRATPLEWGFAKFLGIATNTGKCFCLPYMGREQITLPVNALYYRAEDQHMGKDWDRDVEPEVLKLHPSEVPKPTATAEAPKRKGPIPYFKKGMDMPWMKADGKDWAVIDRAGGKALCSNVEGQSRGWLPFKSATTAVVYKAKSFAAMGIGKFRTRYGIAEGVEPEIVPLEELQTLVIDAQTRPDPVPPPAPVAAPEPATAQHDPDPQPTDARKHETTAISRRADVPETPLEIISRITADPGKWLEPVHAPAPAPVAPAAAACTSCGTDAAAAFKAWEAATMEEAEARMLLLEARGKRIRADAGLEVAKRRQALGL